MSYGFVALLFGIGCGTWVFSKMSHRTGNNYTNSLVVAGVAGVFAAAALFMFMKSVFH